MGELRSPSDLAARLGAIRRDLFGEHGAPELAERLGLSTWAWLGFEAGASVPAQVLARLVQVTTVDPTWLLCGRGPMYRTPRRSHPGWPPTPPTPGGTGSDDDLQFSLDPWHDP
jgi:hypothetical protein